MRRKNTPLELRGSELRRGESAYRSDPLVQSVAKQHRMSIEEACQARANHSFR
jgi:hypothetical protein